VGEETECAIILNFTHQMKWVTIICAPDIVFYYEHFQR